MKKENYVLWVVHTDFAEPGIDPHPASDFGKRKPPKSWHGIKLKSVNKLHLKGVIMAMSAAQEAGMHIVYEAEDKGNRFMKWAKAEGVNVDDIIKIKFDPDEQLEENELVDIFLNALRKKRVATPEIIFAGHHVDICIHSRAEELKKRGFRPYLIVGTAAMYAESDMLSRVRAEFAKERRITIQQLKNFRSLKAV